MKKYALIIILMIASCESELEKENRLFREKVFESSYLQTGFFNLVKLSTEITSVKKGYINEQDFIADYNWKFGYVLGFTKNIDSIESIVKRKEDLYKRYLVADAFVWFSKDSAMLHKYTKEKDSILILIKKK